jgi:HEAT repeat protein
MKLPLFAVLVLMSAAVSCAQADTRARIELTVSGTTFTVGQAIPYTLTVTNTSDQTLSYEQNYAPRILPGHTLRIYDGSRRPLARPVASGCFSVLGGICELRPNARVSFSGYLNQWAVMDKPGNYTVTASWQPRTVSVRAKAPEAASRPVAFRVAAATQQDRDDALASARKLMQSAKDIDQRRDAVWVLGYTLDNRAIPDIIRQSRDPQMGQEWEYALFYLPDKTAANDGLVEEFRDNGPSILLAYAIAHARIPASRVMPLAQHWLEIGDTDQRLGALHSIGMVRSGPMSTVQRQLIEKQLKDPDEHIRQQAIEILAGMPQWSLDYILNAAKNDPSELVRGQAIICLGWTKDKRATEALKELTHSDSAKLSKLAKEALERMGEK